YGETTSTRLCVLPSRGIVVERYSIRVFAADCPLFQHLGFNLVPSSKFFLLSPRSRLPIFQGYVVVSLALGVPRNSVSLLHGSFRYARFYTLISQYADCTFSELGSDERLPTTKVTGVRARFNQKTKHNQKPIWFVFLSFFHKSSSISLYFQRLVKD
ncbi:hypothetical protein, partial [Enterococcus camelliae]